MRGRMALKAARFLMSSGASFRLFLVPVGWVSHMIQYPDRQPNRSSW